MSYQDERSRKLIEWSLCCFLVDVDKLIKAKPDVILTEPVKFSEETVEELENALNTLLKKRVKIAVWEADSLESVWLAMTNVYVFS